MRLLIRATLLLAAVMLPAMVFVLEPDREPDTLQTLRPARDAVLVVPEIEDAFEVAIRGEAADVPDPIQTQTPQAAQPQSPTPVPATAAPTPAPTAAPTPAPTPRPAPTAAPTAAPAATRAPAPAATPVPNATYDREEVRRQIRAAWPGDADEALHVTGCETGWTYNPRTYSAAGPYYGLWQFTQGTWEAYGGAGDPRDASPARQTEVAWNLYSQRGWAPWPGCTPQSPESDDPPAD